MTTEKKHPFRVILAEDDEDDRFLISRALNSLCCQTSLQAVHDGEELLGLLRDCKAESGRASAFPHLILLDLNMPRMDGREALAELKSDPILCMTPAIVLSTSNLEEDVTRCYELGANAYIVKPKAYGQLVETMQVLIGYWANLATLPGNNELGTSS